MVRQRARRAAPTSWRRHAARVAVPGLLAGLATTGIVAVATGSTVAPQAGPTPAVTVAVPATDVTATPQPLVSEQRTSRSTARGALPKPQPARKTGSAKAKSKPKPAAPAPALRVVASRYTRVDLNVRAGADDDAKLVTVLDSGAKLSVTATVRDGWRYISHRGHGAWVKNQYLVERKPKPKAKTAAAAGAAKGLATGACASGSKVEAGLTPDAIRVHRAICARFPAVKAYGGVRADSLPEHPSGRALDAMISSNATGWQIANFVRSNAARLGVSQVLFAQKIWTVQRSGEGWRSMPDRGSATANHYDHVHVTVYGSSGR